MMYYFCPHLDCRIKLSLLVIFVGVFLWCPDVEAYSVQTLTTNVQPLNGTANNGDTFPGAVLPFGMIQWSPDENTSISGGYVYSASSIVGFGLDHISGAGCPYGGSFAFMPVLGSVTTSPASNTSNGKNYFATGFSHNNELATPGYYSVQFTNGIRTELTVTTRTGFGRFTYPSGSAASMVINAGCAAQGNSSASVMINTNGQEVSGWTVESGFCGHSQPVKLYFFTVFDHPFATYGVWNAATLTSGATNTTGAKTGVFLSFDLPAGGVILARTAVSYVSVANARINLATEGQGFDFTSAGFDVMAQAASNIWNGYLNKIQVSGGNAADTMVFYTMMYHALQAPSVVSDVNGQYLGFDGQVHTSSSFTKYEFFSGWDIYRSECQFLAMMAPEIASDMAQSLIQDAHEGGAMPRWSIPSGDTGVMTGDPATPIIGGMYAFGATNFDTGAALAAMVKGAVDPNTVATNGMYERLAERDYLNLGYLPEGMIGRDGPVSVTLEYGSADFTLARFALALDDGVTYTSAMNRAQNWRNLYNTNSGYLQLRRSDGFWPSGFVNNSDTYDANYFYYSGYSRRAYVEGTAAQYVWMIPFNLNGLINRMGGAQVVAARLDKFFTQVNAGTASAYAYVGNEPCSQTPWIYNFVGQPYKASRIVRQVMLQLYSPAPSGLPGNDDLGAMSSWYVWAALGLFPEIPGDDVLTINGPLFPHAVIHLPSGADLTITAAGAGDDAPYVQSLAVNEKTSNASWLRFADLANGATLAFTMGTTANTNWGSDLSIAPPSYMDGMNSPLAQDYYWGTGVEASEAQLTWSNLVDLASYPSGGSNNVGPIQNGLTGPELGFRSENTQSASNSVMYSGQALGGADNHVFLKAFDLSGTACTISSGMHFSYWIFPQSHTNNSLVSGRNSAYVALDLIFTDGTNLRDSGLTDQHGVRVHPTSQGGALFLDTWNYVSVDLTPLVGKRVDRIDLGYEQPNSSGGYRGYVDDVALTTPAVSWFADNLAGSKAATTDSQSPGHLAANGNDGNIQTCWSANDEGPGHWWQVDLGTPCNLMGDEVIWPTNAVGYHYTVAISLDNVNWTSVVNKPSNSSPAQDQTDMFITTGRYVRITITGAPAGCRAGFYEFRVFGHSIPLPEASSGLHAKRRYNGSVTLDWTGSAGATSYNVARATSTGKETIIASSTTTSYVDTGLDDGSTYYYKVSASNLLGQSAYSDEEVVMPLFRVQGSYIAAVTVNNPLAYWPLNETAGTVAYDLVGGYDGTYMGGFTLAQPGIPNGVLGGSGSYAALLDGASGYIDIPQGPFNLTNAITVMAWVKVPVTPHFSGVVGRGDSSWRLSVNASGKPGGNDAHIYGDVIGPSSLVGTNWHMIAYTYSGTPNATNNGLLFVDGLPKGTNTVGVPPGNASDVWIGGAPDYGTVRLLPGSVAHVAIFTNALSAAQVQGLYQIGTNTTPMISLVASGPPGVMSLVWSQGALLQATNIVGAWAYSTATSPCTVIPTNAQMFFRVK